MTQEVMTSNKWIEKARANAAALRNLIASYHPAATPIVRSTKLPITAPNAEMACDRVRKQIQATAPSNPIHRFDVAMDAGDIPSLLLLLDEAWFGVPESTACWGITGFREAVELMEDPPEDLEHPE